MTNIAREERHNWIGGTDVAALFAKSKHKTAFEVWHHKAGNLGDVSSLGERADAGQFMEPAIAAWAQKKWGLQLRKVRRHIPHKTIERFGVSLDYETVLGHVPYEIKNVDSLIFRDFWEHAGDTITRTPFDYLLQCQAQLACTGKPKHGLVACVGGNSLFRMEIERHDEVIAKIEARIKTFWATIDGKKEPHPDFAADAATIAQLYLRSNDGFADLTGNNQLQSVLADYDKAKNEEKAAAKDKRAAKAEALTLINGYSKVVCGEFSISAGTVAEAKIAYTRKPYRNFTLTKHEKE